ncbi:MAG: hypothetical protein ABI939_12640 [Anaerolineaceae bacterium]
MLHLRLLLPRGRPGHRALLLMGPLRRGGRYPIDTPTVDPFLARKAGWLAVLVVACGGVAREGPSGGGGQTADGACADPRPIPQQGSDVESGFLECADGFILRVAPAACVEPVAPGDCATSGGACAGDSDCAERPYGECLRSFPGGGCACAYGCATDADCAGGHICACAGVVDGRSRCVPAECSGGAACDSGLCGLSVGKGPCGDISAALACIDSGSACRVDADCAGREPMFCSGDEKPLQCRLLSGAWLCTEPFACGPCG